MDHIAHAHEQITERNIVINYAAAPFEFFDYQRIIGDNLQGDYFLSFRAIKNRTNRKKTAVCSVPNLRDSLKTAKCSLDCPFGACAFQSFVR